MPGTSKSALRNLLHRLDAHHRFVAATAAAVITLAATHGLESTVAQWVAAWDAFALTATLLAWISLFVHDPYEVRRDAKLQDSNRTLLFTIVIAAAAISLVAVFLLIGASKGLPPSQLALHTTLAITAIATSWTLTHTLFALHYAHYYYFDARTLSRDKIKGGLEFPGEEAPDYFDFVYFSFVVGMTCQVSDVQVTSRRMRRLVNVHGIISFVFNTAIVAASVNFIAGLF